MKKKPLVGIPYMGKGVRRQYMFMHYVVALWRTGAHMTVLKRDTSPEALARYMQLCDGILMPGGPDIHPNRFGQEVEPGCGKIDLERDDFELALMGAALAAKKPVLGICRGVQTLNVACGGTLIQDITPLQTCSHSDDATRTTSAHEVVLEGDSLLREVLQPAGDTIRVNSLHHQVADRVGEGLRVIARSPEGFIEALQMDDRPFCLGVQWHPEHMQFNTPAQLGLFRKFVAVCRGEF